MSKRYGTIVADPPWHYRDAVSYVGKRLYIDGEHIGGETRVAKPLPYESMTVDEIRELPICDIAAKDCALWLWTTSAYLPDAFGILAVWGFKYRQTLVWHKTGARPALGGSVAPNHAEFLLLGKCGVPKLTRLPSSVVDASGNSGETRNHSKKPEVFNDLIERASPAPYCELFARRARFGWDYWGDESLGTVELTISPTGLRGRWRRC